MYDNGRCSQVFHQVFGLVTQSAGPAIYLHSCHGQSCTQEDVMFLHHVFSYLSIFLLIIHFASFLLNKLFSFLVQRAISKNGRNVELAATENEDGTELVSDDEFLEHNGDLARNIFGADEGLLFYYSGSSVKDALLIGEESDCNEKKHSVELEDNFLFHISESWFDSPQEDLADDERGICRRDDQITSQNTVSEVIETPGTQKDSSTEDTPKKNSTEEEEKKDLTRNEKLFEINQEHSESKKYQLKYTNDDKENYARSLGCESTSKSSMEWRASAIFRDSETEYPFSSSSRRSSSNWESFTLFRKYDEEMMFFDRICAQKLTETDSLRSIKVQPRSISKRIVHKLMTKNKEAVKDPYQELENAYVAQICIAWEALNWNYSNFQRSIANQQQGGEAYCCSARVAQQFQQFQVLLQRFIESEPYEHGRRPEIFARTRILSPKLLLVPEFRDIETEESKEEIISSAEFSRILEDAIQTFLNFLKADKEKPCDIIKAFIIKKSSSVDLSLLHLLKKANKKRKRRLKDLVRRRKCLRRRKVNHAQELEIMMSLIDMKIVSRVLRMIDINPEQLHWCEEKMTKVRVWNGQVQRDSSPLFFPIH